MSENKKWIVLRTFNCQELSVSSYLQENHIPHFVPMAYREKMTAGSDKPKRLLVPLIHNYIFVENSCPCDEMNAILAACRYPHHVMKRPGSEHFYEISDAEMTEFRLVCDPGFSKAMPVDDPEIEAKEGKEVVVVHGPFTGVHGRLVRVKGKHYLIKTIADLSVQIHISRWYCKVL